MAWRLLALIFTDGQTDLSHTQGQGQGFAPENEWRALINDMQRRDQ